LPESVFLFGCGARLAGLTALLTGDIV